MKNEKHVQPIGKVLQLNLTDKVINLTNAISLIKQIAPVNVSTQTG